MAPARPKPLPPVRHRRLGEPGYRAAASDHAGEQKPVAAAPRKAAADVLSGTTLIRHIPAMHLAIHTAAFALATLLVAADLASAAESDATKAQPFLGTWEGVEVGREAAGKSRITFEGESVHFQGADAAEWYKGTFSAVTGADQNQLVAKILECPFAQFVGKSSFFIYKVENQKLTLVGHKPGDPNPPKSFDGDATSRTFVFTKVAAR